MLVHDCLRRSAERFPDKVAIVCGDRRITYAQLEACTNQLARALARRGVVRGDRVGIFLNNSIESAIGVFGVLKAGGAFVVVNALVKKDKLAYTLANCGAKVLVTQKRYVSMVREAMNSIPSLNTVLVSGLPEADARGTVEPLETVLEAEDDTPPDEHCIDMDLASILYTSGSTGVRKGVVMTHRNMVSASTSVVTYLENVQEDIVLDVMSLAFSYGLYQLLMCVQVGMTLVLESTFAYPYRVVEIIERERVTGFPGVPTAFAMLLRIRDIADRDFSSVRYLTNAGAALPTRHLFELQNVFTTARIFSMYGLTEVKRATYMPPEELDARPTSVGKAIPNVELWIVKEDGSLTAPGEVGELVVRGSNVMQGYWGMPEETARVLRPGRYPWEKVFYTGDLFTMDEEGYLYFVSRKDDIIKSCGEKVSPKEVESVIYELDGVAEAAVVGVDDEILGQAVKAYVTVCDGVSVTRKQVVDQCRLRLETFMVPKYVEFVDEMPKTDTGKVRRAALRDSQNKE